MAPGIILMQTAGCRPVGSTSRITGITSIAAEDAVKVDGSGLAAIATISTAMERWPAIQP